MKKHFWQHVAVIALVAVTASLVFVGCGTTKRNPDEAIGTYTLQQVEVVGNDHSRNTWYVDGEYSDRADLAELMTLVKNLFGGYRYEIKAAADGGYLYRPQVYSSTNDNWVLEKNDKKDIAEWDADNNFFTFKSSTDTGAEWVNVHVDDAGHKYLRISHNAGTTDTNAQLKQFLNEHDLFGINLRYVLGE